ncbi:hypothetical protein F5H01DRAFT_368785 [Linnemannia elongata]|nr:hypothetical protein F5H01DRAFT_368785 [Linnemannia elongata]
MPSMPTSPSFLSTPRALSLIVLNSTAATQYSERILKSNFVSPAPVNPDQVTVEGWSQVDKLRPVSTVEIEDQLALSSSIMTCIGWLPYGAAFSADLLSGRLNPIRPKTYKVIQGIYNQVLPLFKDKANSIILWMFSRTINIPSSVSQHEDTIIRLRTLATNIKAATS